MNKILSKPFLISLFWKQNEHHRHGVFMHTVKVIYNCIKGGRLDFVPAAILHDIGKPYTANQRKQEDVLAGTYSFDNHEELSWYMIRKCPHLSDKTKQLIRWHYLIRGMDKAKAKGQSLKYNRLLKKWNGLSSEMKADLQQFKLFDDAGK